MSLCIAPMTGYVEFAGSYGTVAWPAHEILLGYVTAIIAGFLLIAIPSWTRRLLVRGDFLFVLFALGLPGILIFSGLVMLMTRG